MVTPRGLAVEGDVSRIMLFRCRILYVRDRVFFLSDHIGPVAPRAGPCARWQEQIINTAHDTASQMRHWPPPLVSGTRVESPDAESKRSAAQRRAGVAIRGARGTPGHTNLRACRTNAQPTSVPVPRDTVSSVSCVAGPSIDGWRTNLGVEEGVRAQ